MLAAFPCAALAGEWLAGNRRRRLVWFGVSAVLLPIMIFGFSRSVMLT
jgi:hypothetical protein